jgi:hypothetical protein
MSDCWRFCTSARTNEERGLEQNEKEIDVKKFRIAVEISWRDAKKNAFGSSVE